MSNLRDGNALFGRWFQSHGGTYWDADLLFGPHVRWHTEPAGLLSWGSAIISASGELNDRLSTLLGWR